MSNCPKDLYDAAEAIMPNVYAPYSNFHVASALRTECGEVFSGVNVENISYGLTFCAEGSAVSKMAGAGKRTIKELVVLVPGPNLCPPCGACRQIISEFATQDCVVYLCTQTGESRKLNFFTELLPCTFNTLS